MSADARKTVSCEGMDWTVDGLPVGIVQSLVGRFWKKVNKNGPVPAHMPHLGHCWIWTAYRDRDGYGRIGRGGHCGPSEYSNRVAFLIAHQRWPDPCALHHCDNPSCVKAWADEFGPAHIFEGTRKDNSVDCANKGRLLFQDPDRRPKGETIARARLTAESVRRIRSGEFASMSQGEIADKFGVTDAAIFHVVAGNTWRHVAKGIEGPKTLPPRGENLPGARLTDESVRKLRSVAFAGLTHIEVARRLGVSRSTIGRILRGERWLHVGADK